MFLRIRSWSDNHVPVNLHQTNFVLTRKSRSCGTTFNLRDPGLAERSAGGSLRARAPDPIRLHHQGRQVPGTQRSVGSGAWAPQASHMVRQGSRLCPRQAVTAIRSQRQGPGRGSPPPQGLSLVGGQPWPGLWSLAGRRSCPSPSPTPQPSSAAGPRTEGPRAEAGVRLLPRSAWGPPPSRLSAQRAH